MISKRLTELVLERDGGVCVIGLPGCLRTATVADHRANRGMGGSRVLDSPECLIAACGHCNGAKENATGQALDWLVTRGVRVRKHATAEATRQRCELTPLYYLGEGLFHLTRDGFRVLWATAREIADLDYDKDYVLKAGN